MSEMPDIYSILWEDTPLIVMDVETTGFGRHDKIIEVSILMAEGGKIIESLTERVNPGFPIPEETTRYHGITDEMVAGKPTIDEFYPQIISLLSRGAPWVGHNLSFDTRMLRRELPENDWPHDIPTLCTLAASRKHPLFKHKGAGKRLGDVASALNVAFDPTRAHGAFYDAKALISIVPKLVSGPVRANYTKLSQDWG